MHHARLRMGCSSLNGDLCFNLHVIDSPQCICGHNIENACHYLLHCPLYVTERESMLLSVSVITNVTLECLLFGSSTLCQDQNEKVFQAVHKYIVASKRF